MIAFYVAPLAVPLITGVYFASIGAPDPGQSLFVAGSAFVAYVGTLVLGVPLYLFLRAQNVTAFVVALAFGLIAGVIVMYVLVGQHMSSGNLRFGGLSGAAVGAILWLIARPDRRTP
jgi:hypothetical protein